MGIKSVRTCAEAVSSRYRQLSDGVVDETHDRVCFFFFFQAEDGIRDLTVTGVQTCALPIWRLSCPSSSRGACRRVADAGQYGLTRTVPAAGARMSRAAGHQDTPPDMPRAAEIGRASCRERV